MKKNCLQNKQLSKIVFSFHSSLLSISHSQIIWGKKTHVCSHIVMLCSYTVAAEFKIHVINDEKMSKIVRGNNIAGRQITGVY